MNPANWLVPFNSEDIKAVQDGKADTRTIIAVLTSQTCGENCWHAKEHVCRCSCGGKNHGCLLVDGAKQPVRAARIDGAMYELEAVDVNPHEIDARLAAEFPPANVIKAYTYYPTDKPTDKPVPFTYQSKNSPLRCRIATKEQVSKWPELTAYRELKPWQTRPYLLWRKVETKS